MSWGKEDKLWDVTRYAFNRPYRLHLGTDAQKVRLLVAFLEFCSMPRTSHDVQEFLTQKTDCPADRVHALFLTLYGVGFGWPTGSATPPRTIRLIDSTFMNAAQQRGEPMLYTTQAAGMDLVRQFRAMEAERDG